MSLIWRTPDWRPPPLLVTGPGISREFSGDDGGLLTS